MKKIKDAILNHKGLAIVALLAFILFIVVLFIFISLFFWNSATTYGDRLDGIEDVKITKDTLKEISSKLEENDEVDKCEIRLQGKIVYIHLNYKEDTSIDKAKEIASSTIENFSEDEIAYYDFSFFLKEESEKEEAFIITGNKHPKVEEIGWIKS